MGKKLVKIMGIISIISMSNLLAADMAAEVAALKAQMSKFEESFKPLEGLRIGVGATFISQGTNDANNNTVNNKNESNVSKLSYSVDIEIEKTFDNENIAFIHLETGDGISLEYDLEVFSNVNRDTDASSGLVSLTEAWYEHSADLFPLTVTFGKIDPTIYLDNNEYANDECTQFLSHIFRNSPVISFPNDNALGFRFASELAEVLSLDFMVMDAVGDGEDVVDNSFFSLQLNFTPFEGGNYRVYGWVNNRSFTDWRDSMSDGHEKKGFGLSFDQAFSEDFGLFFRYGRQESNLWLGTGWSDRNGFIEKDEGSYLDSSWSFGFEASNLGVAYGEVMPSIEYKEAGTDLAAEKEKHFEAYYAIEVTDHLTFSPNVQVIRNAFGGDAYNKDDKDDNIVIGGVRAQISF